MMYLRFLFLFIIMACGGSDQGSDLFDAPIEKVPSNVVIDEADRNLGKSIIQMTVRKIIPLTVTGSFDIENVSVAISGNSNFTLVEDSCSEGVNTGASCDVTLDFLTNTIGNESVDLTISYYNGVRNTSNTFELLVAGDPPLDFSLAASFNFGNKFVNTSTDKIITITNNSTVDATSFNITGLTAPFSFAGGSFPGTGGTCSTTISASTNCTIVLNFNPTSNGLYTNSISFNYVSVGTNLNANFNLSGTGLNPATLSMSGGASYDFGYKATNGYHKRTYTITYTGGDVPALNLGGTFSIPEFTFEGGWPGVGGTCGTILSAGSCTFVASMYASTSGTWSGDLDFNYNNGQVNQTISTSLSGQTGVKPTLSVSDSGTYVFPRYNMKSPSTMTKTYTVSYDSGEVPASNLTVLGVGGAFRFAGGFYPGTGGTCGSSLSSGSCTVVIQFLPTTRSTNHYDSFNFSYNDTLTTNTIVRSTQGATDGLITVFGSTSAGSVISGTSKSFSVRLRLDGGVEVTSVSGATVSGSEITYNSGSYPGSGASACTTGTWSSGDCFLYFDFSPTSNGLQSQSVTINYNDQFSAQTRTFNVTGTGVTPASLAITGTDFGTIDVSDNEVRTFTITNSGGFPATSLSGSGLSTPFTFFGGSYPGFGGNCGSTLNGGASCTLRVQFAPTASGAASDAIDLSYNDGQVVQSYSRTINGTGAFSDSLSLSGTNPTSFGSRYVTTTHDVTFTLTHGGGPTDATSLSGSLSAGDYSFPGGSFPGGGTCGATLTAGMGTCTFIVRFSPTTAGTKTSTFTLNYNSNGAKTITRNLTGIANNFAVLSISESDPYDYGSIPINTSQDKVFTISKTGGNASSLSATALTGAFRFKGGSYPGTGGNCSTIMFTSSCNIVVTFSTATSGSYSDTISLSYYDGQATQSTTRQIQGTALPAAHLSFSPSSYNFGSLTQYDVNERTINVLYSGEGSVTSISANAVSAPFRYKGGSYPGTGGDCSTTLSSGSCSIVVEYAPTGIGGSSTSLTLSYNDGNGSTSRSMTLSGTSVAPAILNFLDGSNYNFGSQSNGSVTEHTFTVQNGGGTIGTSMSASGISGVYRFKGGSYPGTGGTCSTTLAISASCTVVVEYAPTSSGSHSQTLEINYNDGAQSTLATIDLLATSSVSMSTAEFLRTLIPLQEVDLNLYDTEEKFNEVVNGAHLGQEIFTSEDLCHELVNYLFEYQCPEIVFGEYIEDIDNDGFDDYILRLPNYSLSLLISGDKDIILKELEKERTFRRVAQSETEDMIFYFLSGVKVFDIDRDGHDDYITANYYVGPLNIVRIKKVFAYSGKTGLEIQL